MNASFRHPVLTRREDVLRWGMVAAACFAGVCIAYGVQPWWSPVNNVVVAFGVGCPAFFSTLVIRHFTLQAMRESRASLRRAKYLVCPVCRHSIVSHAGTATDATSMRIAPDTRFRCTECGFEEEVGTMQAHWRDAYRIHLDEWTRDDVD